MVINVISKTRANGRKRPSLGLCMQSCAREAAKRRSGPLFAHDKGLNFRSSMSFQRTKCYMDFSHFHSRMRPNTLLSNPQDIRLNSLWQRGRSLGPSMPHDRRLNSGNSFSSGHPRYAIKLFVATRHMITNDNEMGFRGKIRLSGQIKKAAHVFFHEQSQMMK